jgi:hypothetical protein
MMGCFETTSFNILKTRQGVGPNLVRIGSVLCGTGLSWFRRVFETISV